MQFHVLETSDEQHGFKSYSFGKNKDYMNMDILVIRFTQTILFKSLCMSNFIKKKKKKRKKKIEKTVHVLKFRNVIFFSS